MADLTVKTLHKTRPNKGRASYIIADGVVLVPGDLVQLQGGYLNHWDGTGSAQPFIGICLEGDDRAGDGVLTGATGDDKPPEARVDESGVVLMHLSSVAGTPTQAKVGALVYCTDSDPDSMTMTDAADDVVGWLKTFRSSTDVDVQLFTPSEHMAGMASGTWKA